MLKETHVMCKKYQNPLSIVQFQTLAAVSLAVPLNSFKDSGTTTSPPARNPPHTPKVPYPISVRLQEANIARSSSGLFPPDKKMLHSVKLATFPTY